VTNRWRQANKEYVRAYRRLYRERTGR
jgi:hypothetical protein